MLVDCPQVAAGAARPKTWEHSLACVKVREAMRMAWDLALPQSCAGCGRGESGWCALCRGEVLRSGAGASWLLVEREPSIGCPQCWAAAEYTGPLRRALSAYKDGGRRDLAGPLSELLVSPLSRAIARSPSAGRIVVVPVPSGAHARRVRGDEPLLTLMDRAVRLLTPELRFRLGQEDGGYAARGLRVCRTVSDQAGLSARARAGNVSGAFAGSEVLAAATVIVVDDIVTTGATLAEAARAARSAGAIAVSAACVATTPSRLGIS
ncbi:ComF family protein [Austwickia chelonae]|uniref:ComF family protein n=1 Tax=Austwickia chelonae TaxID=100225 RepID=UPI000E24442E|nr:phosphoribosyltransferase family protein [Austwickia chelonae]